MTGFGAEEGPVAGRRLRVEIGPLTIAISTPTTRRPSSWRPQSPRGELRERPARLRAGATCRSRPGGRTVRAKVRPVPVISNGPESWRLGIRDAKSTMGSVVKSPSIGGAEARVLGPGGERVDEICGQGRDGGSSGGRRMQGHAGEGGKKRCEELGNRMALSRPGGADRRRAPTDGSERDRLKAAVAQALDGRTVDDADGAGARVSRQVDITRCWCASAPCRRRARGIGRRRAGQALGSAKDIGAR